MCDVRESSEDAPAEPSGFAAGRFVSFRGIALPRAARRQSRSALRWRVSRRLPRSARAPSETTFNRIPTSSPAPSDGRGDNRLAASDFCLRAELQEFPVRPEAFAPWRTSSLRPAASDRLHHRRRGGRGTNRSRASSVRAASHNVTRQPGQGYKPRIRRATSSAGRLKSRTAAPRDSFGASVASDSSCRASLLCPADTSCSVLSTSGAPSRESRSCSSPAVSTGPIGIEAWARIAPASIFCARRMIELPAIVSP